MHVSPESLDSPKVIAHIDQTMLKCVESQGPSKPIITTKTRSSKKPPTTSEKDKEPKSSKLGKSATETSIDRLKSYIFKCGVRKIWKRELEGLNGKQSIAKLEHILRDLGMEGRPTLEKCRAIKEKREYEEELRALDPNNVIESRLRSRGTSNPRIPIVKTNIALRDSDDESGVDDPTQRIVRPKIDFAAFGDAEE